MFSLSRSKIHTFFSFLYNTKNLEYFNSIHSLTTYVIVVMTLILVVSFLNPVIDFILIILFCALHFFLHLRPSL